MNEEIIKKGLTSKQAERLLKKYGLNEIKETRKFNLATALLSQFDNFLTLLLILAGGVSFFIGEPLDASFIFLIVLLNAFFGLYQEFKAEKALETLKTLSISTVRVVRDGKEEEIDNRYLVPGDLIYLEEGAKIPADAQVTESMHLEINEASLTGESLAVEKQVGDEEKNKLFLGTIVAKGRCHAKVLQTGMQTKFGTIAKTLSQIEKVKTPLQKKLEVFSKQIGIIGILASVTVFILSFIQEKTLIESFIFAVSLAVAAVPEGLPAVMTITLAIGVERMAKKGAIVRKLNAIEALGSVTLVATDKTGTLTTNKMRVKKIWVDENLYDAEHPPQLTNHPFAKLLLNGILCSTASIVYKVDHGDFDIIGDPTEGSVLLLAQRSGLLPEMVKEQWQVVDEKAFDSISKTMSVVVKKNKEVLVFTKGAPEAILSLCNKIMIGKETYPLTVQKKSTIEKEFQRFAKQGLRMIAFAQSLSSNFQFPASNMTFLGFVGMADPIRYEAYEAVKKAQQAGIKVVMITGDNELTAEAIGIEAGIIKEGEDILTGKQLDQYSDEELIELLPKTKIFARTTPHHKYRLVQLFQKLGETVAVTGDGVNDALALKQADVGVAMGKTGTDVAKETADMIITDDNFATLIGAIEQGRNIFNQIKNAIKYLLACNLGEVLYVIFAVVFRLPIITPLQILYINIVTDGLPALSLAFAPHDPNVMREKPRKVMALLEKKDLRYIFFVGSITALLAFLSVLPFMFLNTPESMKTTIVFTTIVLIQPFILVDIWLGHKSILSHFALVKKPIFLLAFFFPFLLHPFLLYMPFFNKVFGIIPPSWAQIIYAIMVSFVILVILEAKKRKNLA